MTTRPGYIWSGTEWVAIGQEAVLAPISYQTSAPSSPATGDVWIDSDDDVPSVNSTLYYRWKKTATGGETSFTGTDDNSLTLAYTAGYESVFINGVLQVRGSDYTATTGTSITGLTALTAGDIVMVESVMAYSVGDTYTQSQMTSLLGGKSDVSSTGLVLLVNQSVGSTPVSSVVVNNAFSSTYDSYKIIISGGTCSANSALRLQMRAGSTTESSALYAGASSATIYANGAYGSDWLGTTSSNWTYVGYANNTAGILSFNCELINPFIADQTLFNSQYSTYNSSRASAGYLNTTTSYDGFVISPETGTITGGTIKVYGYK